MNNKVPRSVTLRNPSVITNQHVHNAYPFNINQQQTQKPNNTPHPQPTSTLTIQWNIIIIVCFLTCICVCGVLILCVYWITILNTNQHRDMVDHSMYHHELEATVHPIKYTHPPSPSIKEEAITNNVKDKFMAGTPEKQKVKRKVLITQELDVPHSVVPKKDEAHKNIILMLDQEQLNQSSLNSINDLKRRENGNGWFYKETITSISESEDTSSTSDLTRKEFARKMLLTNEFNPYYDLPDRTKKVVSQFIKKNVNDAACCCQWQWVLKDEMGGVAFKSCAPLNRMFLGFTEIIDSSSISGASSRIAEDLSFECYLSGETLSINFGLIKILIKQRVQNGKEPMSSTDFYGYTAEQQFNNKNNKNETLKDIQVKECFIDLMYTEPINRNKNKRN